jgi:hypothetical protein
MGIKDEVGKVLNKAKDTVANVKDAANEATHRSAAAAEQTKRDVAGDQMTVGENVGSMFNQATNSMQADTDAAKRDVRNSH